MKTTYWIIAHGLLVSTACSDIGGAQTEQVGVARVSLTNAPTDVRCMQFTVSGERTVQRSFDLDPGDSTVLLLRGLPLGVATFTGLAYGEACGQLDADATATWESEPAVATISMQETVDVLLTMRRVGGQANVAVDFVDDAIGDPDGGPPSKSAIQNPYNGHWYQRIDQRLSWHQARDSCSELGGYLVSVTSSSENMFVYDALVAPDPQLVWLGATDEVVEGQWAWTSGEPFVYANWVSYEPNNLCQEDYLIMWAPVRPDAFPSQWNDVHSGIDVHGNAGFCEPYTCPSGDRSCETPGPGCGCPGSAALVSTICEWNNKPSGR